MYEVSPFLRCTIYVSVSTTFLTACLGAGYSLPAKIKNALIGFGIYTVYALAAPVLRSQGTEIPELVTDIFLAQYYVMTLWCLMLACFFTEFYSDEQAAERPKICYFQEKHDKATAHIFSAKPKNAELLERLDKTCIDGLKGALTPDMI